MRKQDILTIVIGIIISIVAGIAIATLNGCGPKFVVAEAVSDFEAGPETDPETGRETGDETSALEASSDDSGAHDVEPAADTGPEATSETSSLVDSADAAPVVTAIAMPRATTVGACWGSMELPHTDLGYCKDAGDYMLDSVERSVVIKRVTVDLKVFDQTAGCAVGDTHKWDVEINGSKVGSMYLVTEKPNMGDRRLKGSFNVSISATATKIFFIKIVAASSVCDGGGSWQFRAGGSIVLE